MKIDKTLVHCPIKVIGYQFTKSSCLLDNVAMALSNIIKVGALLGM